MYKSEAKMGRRSPAWFLVAAVYYAFGSYFLLTTNVANANLNTVYPWGYLLTGTLCLLLVFKPTRTIGILSLMCATICSAGRGLDLIIAYQTGLNNNLFPVLQWSWITFLQFWFWLGIIRTWIVNGEYAMTEHPQEVAEIDLSKDPGVQAILAAKNEEEALAAETTFLVQTDNGDLPDDPEPETEDEEPSQEQEV